jgi:hypothetical protein
MNVGALLKTGLPARTARFFVYSQKKRGLRGSIPERARAVARLRSKWVSHRRRTLARRSPGDTLIPVLKSKTNDTDIPAKAGLRRDVGAKMTARVP